MAGAASAFIGSCPSPYNKEELSDLTTTARQHIHMQLQDEEDSDNVLTTITLTHT